ncbi:MAG: heme-binding protein [Minisyncoccia bacterium]
MKITVLLVLGVVFIAWNVWGYFASNVEQAQYSVTKKAEGYEIRTYAPHIVAQATVTGDYEEALNEGFRIIAGYIFGGNTAKQKVAMTAPVTEQAVSENVAMTAPVTASLEAGPRTVAFVMPKAYTLDTLPIPNDSRVKLVPMPERTMAVVTFSWYRTTSRVEEMEKELLELVKRDGLTVIGTPIYAGYNAPWTPPWLLRNEVMVEVEK